MVVQGVSVLWKKATAMSKFASVGQFSGESPAFLTCCSLETSSSVMSRSVSGVSGKGSTRAFVGGEGVRRGQVDATSSERYDLEPVLAFRNSSIV